MFEAGIEIVVLISDDGILESRNARFENVGNDTEREEWHEARVIQ